MYNWKKGRRYPKQDMHMCVHSCTVLKGKKTVQMAIGRWMGKQTVVDTHSEVFVSHRKEWSTKTFCNEEEPQRDYAQVKQSQKVTYCKTPLTRNIWKRETHTEGMQIGGCWGLGRGGNGKLLDGKGLDFGRMGMLGTRSGGCITREYTKCHWIVHFKVVNLMLYAFHLRVNYFNTER